MKPATVIEEIRMVNNLDNDKNRNGTNSSDPLTGTEIATTALLVITTKTGTGIETDSGIETGTQSVGAFSRKRMQGLSNEGPSSSDHLFASTPVRIPMPYGPQMVPMPIYGHIWMPQPGAYPGFEHNMMQQSDWSGNFVSPNHS